MVDQQIQDVIAESVGDEQQEVNPLEEKASAVKSSSGEPKTTINVEFGEEYLLGLCQGRRAGWLSENGEIMVLVKIKTTPEHILKTLRRFEHESTINVIQDDE